MKRRIFWLLSLFVLTLCFLGCNDTPDEPTPPPVDDGNYRVMIALDDGATVVGENPVTVKRGEDVSFQIQKNKGYVYSSVTYGVYDDITGVLTIKGVDANMTVDFVTEAVDYDTDQQVRFLLRGNSTDTASIPHNTFIKLGTVMTVSARNEMKYFLGWSFLNNGALVSQNRDFTFRVTPDILSDLPSLNGAEPERVLNVYSFYTSADTLYYDPNGGFINSDTTNAQGNELCTAELTNDNKLKITLPPSYIAYTMAASALYDDGTFYRPGYVLKEYNTKRDGSGTSYAPGNKVNQLGGTDAKFTLYCIWEKDSDLGLFGTEEYRYSNPSVISGLDGYVTSGVMITSYMGSERLVTVPETIDGKRVIGIAAGAFTDRKDMQTLVLPRTLQFIRDGAFTGCTALSKMYYPASVLEVSDGILDAETHSALKTLVVRANMAPRFANHESGSFSVKLSKLMTSAGKRIVVLGGSSAYQGFSSEYFEALFGGEYTVINFGTTRTTHGALYLEAITPYLREGDVVIYTPENSIYMWGDTTLYWKTLRDIELMNNLIANVDISRYNGVFDALGNFTADYTAKMKGVCYEHVYWQRVNTTPYGDEIKYDKKNYYVNERNYTNAYYITLNHRVKSTLESYWADEKQQEKDKDYTDLDNKTWITITGGVEHAQMNYAIDRAKSSGAKITFGFAPVDEDALVNEAKNLVWTDKYDRMIKTAYNFDGVIGQSHKYVFAHEYFYDCAFHTNNYGRPIRTYQLYIDLCAYLGIEEVAKYNQYGFSFLGCKFEEKRSPLDPLYPVYIFRD